MPQFVEVPDFGTVEFPDGMSPDEMSLAIRSNLSPEPPKLPGGILTQAGIGARQGFSQLGQAGNATLQAAVNIPFSPLNIANRLAGGAIEEQFRGASEVAGRRAQELEQLGEATGGPKMARRIAAGAVSIAPAIAASPVGIPAAIAASAVQSFGGTYADAQRTYQEQGMSPEEAERKARGPAVASGLVTAAVTAAGGKFAPGVEGWTKAITAPGFRQAAVQVLKNAGVEAVEEGVDQLGQAVVSKLSTNPEMTLEQALTEAAEAAVVGGVLGGGLSAVRQATAPGVAPEVQQPPVIPPPIPQTDTTMLPAEEQIELTEPESELTTTPVDPVPPETVVPENVTPVTEVPTVQESLTVDQPSPFTPEALQTEGSKTLGITPNPSAFSPVSIKRTIKNAMAFLRPRGDLQQEDYARLQLRDAEIAASDRDIAWSQRDLMNALRETYGLSRVETLGGGTKRIPVAAVELMTKYLAGDPTVSARIPSNIQGVLNTMRTQIDTQSQRVIDRLQSDLAALPPGSVEAKNLQDLIDTIRNNMDVYLHRAYKFFDSKDKSPDWYDRLPPGIRIAAENYVAGSSPVPLSPTEARASVLRWLSDLKGFQFGRGKLGAKDPSILMRRKVVPPELRAVLGEYRSPLTAYAKSVHKMASWVANHKFLNDVKRNGMGRWLFEDGTDPPGFNTRIAAEGSDSMSPLNGLRTSQEIADAFALLGQDSGPKSALARLYYTFVAQTKFAATVQSILTQSRNLISRPMMAAMAGHWNPAPVGESARALWADIAGTDKARQAFIREAYEYGVLGDTARGRELAEIIKDASLQDVNPADISTWSLTRFVKNVGWKIPQTVYRASDELGNLVGWANEIDHQSAIHPTWSPEQVRRESAKIVRELYPTYSETPEAVRFFRKVPLTGPFVTFPYQVIRTMFNSTMRGVAEVRSSNPVEQKIGAKRLAGVTAALTMGYGLQEFTKALMGISDREEEDYRLFQPEWSKNSKFAFIGKDQKSGELKTINLSYIDPYAYMTDPVMSIISSVRTDEPMDDMIARAAKEFFSPWFSEQMLTTAIADVARNKTQGTGREVYSETDSFFQKAVDMGKHIGKTLVPGTIQRVEKRIMPAFRGEPTTFGRKLEPATEVVRELSGVAVEDFDFQNGLAFKSAGFSRNKRDVEDKFRRAATQTGSVSADEVFDAYVSSDEDRFEQYQLMRQYYLAAIRRGVPARKAQSILEARGMARSDVQSVGAGLYMPLQISDATMTRAREVGREIPLKRIYDYQKTRRGVTLDSF